MNDSIYIAVIPNTQVSNSYGFELEYKIVLASNNKNDCREYIKNNLSELNLDYINNFVPAIQDELIDRFIKKVTLNRERNVIIGTYDNDE